MKAKTFLKNEGTCCDPNLGVEPTLHRDNKMSSLRWSKLDVFKWIQIQQKKLVTTLTLGYD
jgi:hypothetical protein